MPPKKKAPPKKGGDEVDVTVQMKRVKAEMNKAVAERELPPEVADELVKFLVGKIQESLSTSSLKLIFTGDKPGPLGVQLLAAVMRELTPNMLNMKTLCFWKTLLGDPGLRSVCQWVLPLRKNEVLNYPGFLHLELVDCRVSTVGCDYLAQSLRTNVPLQSLCLDFNAIGDEGVAMLAEGLRYNRELAKLSLGYCRIGPAGGTVIGDEIIRSSKLKRILLPGNRIMEMGLMAISRNLGKSSTLVELDISDNSIGPEAAALNQFCEGLRTNTSLEKVNMDSNVIGVDGAMLLQEALGMCANIKIFQISGKGVPAEIFKEVNRDGKAKKGKKGKTGGKKKK